MNVVGEGRLKGNPVAATFFGEKRRSGGDVWESFVRERNSRWKPHLMVCRLCESKVPLHKYLVRFDYRCRLIQSFAQRTWSI